LHRNRELRRLQRQNEDRGLLACFVIGAILIVAWFMLILLCEPFARPWLPGLLG